MSNLLLLFCVALLSAGTDWMNLYGIGHYIFGGYETSIDNVPYLISLQFFNTHLCGGSIISKSWIITAAHCIVTSSASSYHVRVGSSEHASGGSLIPVKQVVLHPLYSDNDVDYDYALMELRTGISFGKYAHSVALPAQNESVPDGTLCLISGWGKTKGADEFQEVARAAEVPIFNQTLCNALYKPYGGITDRMICAGYTEGGKDSCQGDSGGPLVANGKLIGVISWGVDCGRPDFPGVYARVAAVRDWIRSTSGV